ncbi:MAG TPA: hypothetical protein VKA68_14075 [bacterium]|nr:hypothetical protein [bacterium]
MNFRKPIPVIFSLLLLPSICLWSAESSTKQSKQEDRDFFQQKILNHLNRASHPSKFFVIPTGKVLRTMEVYASGGSFYGEKESGGVEGRIGLGLGNVAEIELSSTRVENQLTGRESRFPSRTFKVHLVPEAMRYHWYIPQMALQLRSAAWSEAIEQGDPVWESLRSSFAYYNDGLRLESLALQTRFTTLYAIVGFEGELGGLYGGMSLTDVRTRGGRQWIYAEEEGTMEFAEFSARQKNILQPFGGFIMNANQSTQILAEVSTIPNLDYDVRKKEPLIDYTWVGVAGIRFYMLPWLSLDTGVRYLSTFEGIADADINLAVNAVLPLKKTW